MNRQLKQAALQVPDRLRGPAFGGITFRPTRYIPGRCGIGCGGVSAAYAAKPVPAWTVAAINAAAFRASLTGISRVNRDYWHAMERSLVGHETPKLGEGPTVVRPPLATLNRCPGADMRQVFQPDAASGALSLAHDSLADPVVEVGGEPGLLPAAFLKQPLGRLGSFLLKLAPQPGVSVAEAGVVRAAMGVAVAVGSDVAAPKVNAEVFRGIAFRHAAHVHGHVKEEPAISVDQIGLTAREGEAGLLVGTRYPRHHHAPVQGQDRNAVRPLPRQDALVVGNRAMPAEGRSKAAVALVDLDHLRDGPHRHLGRQIEVAPNVVVHQFLQLDLVGASVGVRNFGNRVASSIAPLHRRQKRNRLLWRWQEFGLHGQVHGNFVAGSLNRKQALPPCGRSAIPPGPEGPGFSRRLQ